MTRAPSHPWYDSAWPAVTGLATGTGLLAAYRGSGPLVTAIALSVLVLTLVPLTWCVLTELRRAARGAARRIGLATALGIFALVGMGELMGSWAFLVVAFVLVTSPLVRGWTDGGLRTSWAERMSPRTETRRRFDEIVGHGFGASDDDLPPR
ncbi:MAG TPA: hypothetical protein VGK78_01135 [Nocardioides sp.]|uniref:hypothetical protein n=1 Tax=Nocardioides sp. TaxID=35761 RepID=UPI002F3F37F3